MVSVIQRTYKRVDTYLYCYDFGSTRSVCPRAPSGGFAIRQVEACVSARGYRLGNDIIVRLPRPRHIQAGHPPLRPRRICHTVDRRDHRSRPLPGAEVSERSLPGDAVTVGDRGGREVPRMAPAQRVPVVGRVEFYDQVTGRRAS